jgi:membrane-bound metal-dependent hydrolase YbcI (DUF457 family)
MPSPVAHSLTALALRLLVPATAQQRVWMPALFLVVLANLPDVDFIPGYLTSDPRAYHWGPTHSVTAALAVALLVGWVAQRSGHRFKLWFLLAGTAYGSHLMLDLLLGPGAPSIGLQILWPFSTDRFMARVSVFRMAPASIAEGPVAAFFSLEMLPIIAREVLILLPVVIVAWFIGRARQSRHDPGEIPTPMFV